MQRPENIENVKKRIRSEWGLQYEVENFVWARSRGRNEVGSSHEKFSKGEPIAERGMRFFRAQGSLKLRQVASGSATQNLWLRDRKVRSQVVVINLCRFPEEKHLEKGGKKKNTTITEWRIEQTELGSDLDKKDKPVWSHALALALVMTKKTCGRAEM